MTSKPKMKTQIVIVTPALTNPNNGNWQTTRRWARLFAGTVTVRLVQSWPDNDDDNNVASKMPAHLGPGHDAVMLALHARRSAASIAAWHAQRGSMGLGVVLTGTDLYHDIAIDFTAQRSLTLAQALVVLQDRAPDALPPELHAKARVIFQSATTRKTLDKPGARLRVVMVGHLRHEKSPETLFAVARRLAGRRDILIDHIGAALDPALGQAATATMSQSPNYRWLGGLPHESVRRRIQRAHLLLHTSRLEGGAHVIMEAVTCGTPVLASHIDGNVGMLGAGYAGYFPLDDGEALAELLIACQESRSRQDGGLLAQLARQCNRRAPLFAPETERKALGHLVAELSKNY